MLPLFCSDKILDDEWNLLYVAVTRAKTSLIITKSISRILTVAGVRYNHPSLLTAHAALYRTLIRNVDADHSLKTVYLRPIQCLRPCKGPPLSA